VGVERRITGILSDHLAHLVRQLLPVVNEISSLLSRHHFRALLFENGKDDLSARAARFGLIAGYRLKRGGDTIELGGDLRLDSLRPLDLAGCSGHGIASTGTF
jgi:hypothetical protein